MKEGTFWFFQHLVIFASLHAMQKFQDFCIIQILREINFEGSKSAKSAILTLLQALNVDFYEFLHFLKSEINQINKLQSPKNGKNSNFRPSIFSKLDFT